MVDSPDTKFRLTKAWIIIFIVAIISIITFGYLSSTVESPLEYSEMPSINASDRVLIFSTHPDDESLGTSGIIQKALKANASVTVVEMTTGDSFAPDIFQTYLNKTNNTSFKGTIGDMRHLEALNAVKKLGLNESNIIFLGYPDAGLRALMVENWDSSNPYKPATGSNQNDRSPYNFTYEKNVIYSGENVAKNVKQIMVDYKPTIIFYPDDGDDHPDHWATSAFVRYAAIETNYTGQGYTYLVHKGVKWPTPMSYQPQNHLYFADELSVLTNEWFYSSLTSDEEKNKGEAINSHSTQVYMTKDLLQSFIRLNEVFASYSIIPVDKISDVQELEQQLPNSTYQDVKNDPQTQVLQQVEDLSSAGMAYDDNNLYLYLQTKNNIKNNTNYNFHLRVYQNSQFKTVDINFKDGEVTYLNTSTNSIQPASDPEIFIDDDLLTLSLPLDLVEGVKYVLMTVEIADDENKKNIDFMSWRVFEFPEKWNTTNSTNQNLNIRTIG